jgi:DNA mismatch endonuclease (patch repair protein)
VDVAPLHGSRRRADLVFTRARVAVFIDGCFWHGCPAHASAPKSNKEWWAQKLGANVRRDRDTDATLEASGWTVIRVWEHEDPEDAAARIENAVRAFVYDVD